MQTEACGGKQFALVELMAVLSVFLANARFEPTSDAPVRFFWKSQMLREGGQRVRVLPIGSTAQAQ
jgi:cytochrome P450